MRKFFVAAAVAVAAFAWSSESEAGYRNYTICWESLGGGSECASLPENYRIKGVEKPYCDRESRCDNGIVYFTLTRSIIRCLERYVDTSNMRPYQRAMIHAKTH